MCVSVRQNSVRAELPGTDLLGPTLTLEQDQQSLSSTSEVLASTLTFASRPRTPFQDVQPLGTIAFWPAQQELYCFVEHSASQLVDQSLQLTDTFTPWARRPHKWTRPTLRHRMADRTHRMSCYQTERRFARSTSSGAKALSTCRHCQHSSTPKRNTVTPLFVLAGSRSSAPWRRPSDR